MSYEENIWAGVPPKNKNGACSCWSTCSTTWPPCREKSIKDAPKDCNWRWPSQPLNTLYADPFRVCWFRDPKGCRTSLACSSTQHAPPTDNKMSAWGSCAKNSPGTWPGLACKVKLVQLGPLWEARDDPAAILLHRPNPPQPGLRGQSQPSDLEKTPWWDDLGWEADGPILGEGIGWWGARAPPLHALTGASHPPLALHDPVMLTSGSATPWNISTCNQWPMSLGAGHGKITSPIEDRPPRRKQVRSDVDEELGNDPTLPPGLTLFLAEGMVTLWDDSPSSSTPMPMDSPWPAPSKSPQSHPAYMGGASLKSQPNHQLVDPDWDPNQGPKKGHTQ